jgi:hypothetical protein
LRLINAYETAFNISPDLKTTRFNVFSTSELAEIEVKLQDLFGRLLESASPYPEGRAPSPLLGRLNEVRHELNGLGAEKALRRDAVEAPRVARFGSDISLADAERKFPELAQLRRDSSVEAELLLRTEIEYRLLWSPSDASLRSVRGELAIGSQHTALALLVAQPTRPDIWPPRPTPPPSDSAPVMSPDGPLPPPAPGSVKDLPQMARAELDAARRGDSQERAEARARRSLHEKFIQRSTGTSQDGRALSLAAMADEELDKFRDDYSNWEKALVDAKARGGPAGFHGEAELVETRRWIEAIGVEQRARSPPPTVRGLHRPSSITNALHTAPSVQPDVDAFRDVAELTLERERLTAMREELDRPRAVPDVALEEAYRDQAARVLRAEVESINRAAAKLDAAVRVTVRDGRGFQGRLAGSLTADAHALLRAQAQGLQPMLKEAIARSPAAANFLKDVALRPSLLLPPPSDLKYRPERMQEIAFKLRAANGTQALPRAPPIVVDMEKDVSQRPLRAPRLESASSGPRTTEFERLYKPVEADSYAKLVEDIRRAPGGVIVDASLAGEWGSRLGGVGYDLSTGRMWIRLDGKERNVAARITPAIARAAWGFALDGRVAAIDLRTPSNAAISDLIRTIIPWDKLQAMRDLEIPELRKEIENLLSVNLHPALVDTSLGGDLIGADELIFQALKLAPIFKASDSRFHGIDVTDLRQALEEDLTALKLGSAIGNYKSILSVSTAEMTTEGQEVKLAFKLRYEIFQMYGDRPPVRFERVSNWFSAHDAVLRQASPELQQLIAFASAVALWRSAQTTNASFEASDLVAQTEDVVTPSFICRGAVLADCELRKLRELTSE